MKGSQVFPSKYLKAQDIPQGQFAAVTIDRVQMEDVSGDGEDKPVIYFRGKNKGMVLNRTNWSSIADVYGDESDNWSGQQVSLYQTTTQFQGKNTPCLRVQVYNGQGQGKPAAAPPRQQPKPQPPENPIPEDGGIDVDSIPF